MVIESWEVSPGSPKNECLTILLCSAWYNFLTPATGTGSLLQENSTQDSSSRQIELGSSVGQRRERVISTIPLFLAPRICLTPATGDWHRGQDRFFQKNSIQYKLSWELPWDSGDKDCFNHLYPPGSMDFSNSRNWHGNGTTILNLHHSMQNELGSFACQNAARKCFNNLNSFWSRSTLQLRQLAWDHCF